MTLIDWIITAIPLIIVLVAGLYSRKYVRSVADFMSASRSAGRYTLCIASSEMQAGAVVFVAYFEMFAHGGFSMSWWWNFNQPATIIMAITGWVVYRYRETRAMTLSQFFEIRYNKSFRVLAGITGFVSGILNFGVIPAVGARALVYFLGLPETVTVFSMTMPTFAPLMALFLTITAFIAVSGGIITVMVINTIEGIISQILYVVLILTIYYLFRWSQINTVLTDPVAHPAGYSLVNPFDSFGISDFNIWYVLISVWGGIIGRMAWQNSGAYNSAPLNAHEGRMAGILGSWRDMGKGAVIVFLAMAAVTYLHHPDFATGAAQVHTAVANIADSQAREEMAAPIALAHLLPEGVRGALCVILLMGIFGGDATHLHSWGSIFVQDVLVPLRKKPFGVRTHLFVLRCAILFVACFAFVFGVSFQMNDYINMWWGITCSIFGGAGPVLVGGLYWKKGTSAAAWATFLTGSVLSLGAIWIRMVYHSHGASFVQNHTHLGFIDLGYFAALKDGKYEFFMNGTYLGFYAGMIALAIYIIVSLLTCKEDFNLERMLHRGKYASVKKLVGDSPLPVKKEKVIMGKLIGIDENFTRSDKWIAISLFGWTMLNFTIFLVVSGWNLVAPWQTASWSIYWHITSFALPIFFAVVTGIWFTWGGIKDIRLLFQRLRDHKVNALDDGTVVDNQNLDELAAEKKLDEAELRH